MTTLQFLSVLLASLPFSAVGFLPFFSGPLRVRTTLPADGLDGVTPKVAFRPKQSLGQNYLSDQNYVLKICNALGDGGQQEGRAEALGIAADEGGRRVIELGPGAGALSRVLVDRYPNMLAIELDKRAIDLLAETFPQLTVGSVYRVDEWYGWCH